MQSHEGRVAVVTGAGRGIGRAVAVELVVNNAGIYPFATIDDLDYDLWLVRGRQGREGYVCAS